MDKGKKPLLDREVHVRVDYLLGILALWNRG